jgi:hypothetical protein
MGVYLELRGKPTGLRMLGLVALASAVAVLAVASLGVLCGLAAWRLLAVALVFTANSFDRQPSD